MKNIGGLLAIVVSVATMPLALDFGSMKCAYAAERAGEKLEKAISVGADSLAFEAGYLKLVDSYFDYLFAHEPSWATAVGFHQYDRNLEDWSPQALEAHRKALAEFRAKFVDIYKNSQEAEASKRGPLLSAANLLDCRMVLSHIDGSLFELDEMKTLRRDPDRYSSHIADSIFALTKRNFAPLNDRFENVIARMEKAPRLLAQGRANLDPKLVPPVFAAVALEQLPGTIELFEKTIPAAFGDASPVLKERFKKAQKRLLASLKDYGQFLKTEIVPHARGSFAIGAERYAKKLRYDEMVDEKLDVLLSLGYAELHRLQARFRELAREVDPQAKVEDCFVAISSNHPQPDKLVSSTAAVLDSLIAFIEKKDIVTIPGKDRVTVAESPSFLRALTFASMDTPGPYEKAKEAFYYVTPAEPNWSKQKVEEHMRSFSYPDLINTSVHEAYPGHYVQFLWVNKVSSKVRKLLGCSSNAEGWAHYCEEMMLEQGLNSERPPLEQKKFAMVQVHDALLRVCRYIVGIEMHTNGWSYERGRDFFIKEGYMEKANAEREAKRGTSDPTYLVYTLGKLEILRLRADYEKKMGTAFNLRDFHDSFLRCGFPPLKIVRAELGLKP